MTDNRGHLVPAPSHPGSGCGCCGAGDTEVAARAMVQMFPQALGLGQKNPKVNLGAKRPNGKEEEPRCF